MSSANDHLLQTIRASVIGENEAVDGPFGVRRVTYADYTASGRSLSFIEDFLRAEVLPLYANTHTEASGTGLQTTHFREEAREIIAGACGCTEQDLVIFTGSGATGAIDKLIRILNLQLPLDLDARFGLNSHIPPEERPVVFIGPYEHHSNELIWRHSIADLVVIPEDTDGQIDQAHLERELERYRERPLKIGSFSAASNVTGILSNTVAIAKLLHRHGGLSFWDYAAAGPYERIQMTPQGHGMEDAHLDAVFLSPHKFIGGPGTPGVLLVKRRLVRNAVPTVPGGGTVAFVYDTSQVYFDDPVHREEAGTPAIVESIRAGLVFQLKEAVGQTTIKAREHALIQRALEAWRDLENVEILGNPNASRLSIVSFIVRHGKRFLHHNFVVALLNDLFGIQSRGGCSCAGPYGMRLLAKYMENRDTQTTVRYATVVSQGCEGIKPGWTRLNFNYFISNETTQFLLDAVAWIARHGWKLLPLYRFDPLSSLWRHREGRPGAPMSLHDLSYAGGHLNFRSRHLLEPESALAGYLEEADHVLSETLEGFRGQEYPYAPGLAMDADFEALRWFPLPWDIAGELGATPVRVDAPREAPAPHMKAMRDQRLESYFSVLKTAYLDGIITADEEAMLETTRTLFHITPDEHQQVELQVRAFYNLSPPG